MKYNIYTEDNGAPAFNVKVSSYRATTRGSQGRNCAMKTLEVCAR